MIYSVTARISESQLPAIQIRLYAQIKTKSYLLNPYYLFISNDHLVSCISAAQRYPHRNVLNSPANKKSAYLSTIRLTLSGVSNTVILNCVMKWRESLFAQVSHYLSSTFQQVNGLLVIIFSTTMNSAENSKYSVILSQHTTRHRIWLLRKLEGKPSRHLCETNITRIHSESSQQLIPQQLRNQLSYLVQPLHQDLHQQSVEEEQVLPKRISCTKLEDNWWTKVDLMRWDISETSLHRTILRILE